MAGDAGPDAHLVGWPGARHETGPAGWQTAAMTSPSERSALGRTLGADDPDARTHDIVDTLTHAFADLMSASPDAFRTKFRKMAADPFAFYRGTACLFYADMVRLEDRWADARTSRVWIQGDHHVENFGTYMDSDGALVFDLNDFDEAYIGHFTWDLRRLVASLALLGWGKAFSDDDIDGLAATYLRSYLDTVRRCAAGEDLVPMTRRSTDGAVLELLRRVRATSRESHLDAITEIDGDRRVFREGPGVRRLDDDERTEVVEAYTAYLDTIPAAKRMSEVVYRVVDVVGRSGFGIGSAGLPAYNVLIEGFNEALDNDVVISMKQSMAAAPSGVVTDEEIWSHFHHHGHRAAVSRRALQAHADRFLGWTEMRGVGYLVSELSPYVDDFAWEDLTEPDQIEPVLRHLGRATATSHCVADADSEQDVVDFQVEDAVLAVVKGHEDEFVDDLVAFAPRLRRGRARRLPPVRRRLPQRPHPGRLRHRPRGVSETPVPEPEDSRTGPPGPDARVRVMLVEDDAGIRRMLTLALAEESVDVLGVASAEEALETLDDDVAVVLVDLMLPGMDGLALCRALRARTDVPLLVVTARSDTRDVIAGLEAGADDYVTKPVVPGELAARIRALLRRARVPERVELGLGDLRIRPEEGVVRRGEATLALTRTEFRLLVELAGAAGRVVSREELLTRVWGYDYFGDTRLLDVHVRRLRRKVEPDPDAPTLVLTVRGVGYRAGT